MSIVMLHQELSVRLTRAAHFFGKSVNDLVNEVLDRHVNQVEARGEIRHELTPCLSDWMFRSFANAIDRYLFILGYVANLKPALFEELACGLRGNFRQYFGLAPGEIEKTGRSTDPKPIPGTRYWACGNLSNWLKKVVMRRVLRKLGFSKLAIAEAVRSITQP